MSVERGREKAEKSYPISRIQLPNGAGDNVWKRKFPLGILFCGKIII